MKDEEKVLSVGGQDAGYLFTFDRTGVYLTVYPSERQKVFSALAEMRKILHENQVTDYDVMTLIQTVRQASGQPVFLSGHFVPAEEDGARKDGAEKASTAEEEAYASVVIDVLDKRMVAKVHFDLRKGKKLPTVEMVKEALVARNITYGIDEKAIEKGVQSFDPFVVAMGIPPQPGKNARIIKNYDLGIKGRPKEIAGGRVDYKDMNLFVLVKKGQLLARRIPQTEGVPGRDIFGVEIAARNGLPCPMPTGNNTEVQDDNLLVASIDGQIVENGRLISVDPHYEIRGNVGVGTGNINFTGSVKIGGSVEAGFIVKATGDIEVEGLVSGANITGKNVFVGGGISGRSLVRAEQDVRAAFVENATVEAQRDIFVSDVVLHSTLRAGKKIIVEEKRGAITGGDAAAGEQLRANVLGNTALVATKVQVGVNPSLKREYQATVKEYKELFQRLSQIRTMLNTIAKIDTSKLPPLRVRQINALSRSQFPLAGKVKRTEERMEKMKAELEKMTHGTVRVRDIIYPGVHVFVNEVAKNFTSEARGCTLELKDDQVTIGPY